MLKHGKDSPLNAYQALHSILDRSNDFLILTDTKN